MRWSAYSQLQITYKNHGKKSYFSTVLWILIRSVDSGSGLWREKSQPGSRYRKYTPRNQMPRIPPRSCTSVPVTREIYCREICVSGVRMECSSIFSPRKGIIPSQHLLGILRMLARYCYFFALIINDYQYVNVVLKILATNISDVPTKVNLRTKGPLKI